MGIITNCIRYIFGANSGETGTASIPAKRKRSSEEDNLDVTTVGKNSLNSVLPPVKRARMDNDNLVESGPDAHDEAKSPLKSFVKSFKAFFLKSPKTNAAPNREEESNGNLESNASTSNIETIDLVSGKFLA